MMNGDGFPRAEICQPAEAVTERRAILFRFLQMLMKALQRGDGETLRRKPSGFAHHPRFVVAVAMQRDQERARAASFKGHVEIVIKLNLCGQRALRAR